MEQPVRIARSMRHPLTALEEFDHQAVRLVRVQDRVDTGSPMGRAKGTIIGAMSTDLSLRATEKKKASRAGRGIAGEIIKRAQAVQPETL